MQPRPPNMIIHDYKSIMANQFENYNSKTFNVGLSTIVRSFNTSTRRFHRWQCWRMAFVGKRWHSSSFWFCPFFAVFFISHPLEVGGLFAAVEVFEGLVDNIRRVNNREACCQAFKFCTRDQCPAFYQLYDDWNWRLWYNERGFLPVAQCAQNGVQQFPQLCPLPSFLPKTLWRCL